MLSIRNGTNLVLTLPCTSHLPPSTTQVFGRYGHIEEVTIVYDRKTGRSRGFGFVTFEDQEDAREARDAVSGMEIDGRAVRVDFSVTKRAHTPTPGMYMGRPTR